MDDLDCVLLFGAALLLWAVLFLAALLLLSGADDDDEALDSTPQRLSVRAENEPSDAQASVNHDRKEPV